MEQNRRRERLERKLEKRQEWADGRDGKAASLDRQTPDSLRHDWAFITQPGRIPERSRMNRRDDKAHEHRQMADHHRSKAAGLASQLDRTIFSDDDNAIEALQEKIAGLEKQRATLRKVNAAYRKFKKNPESLDASDLSDRLKQLIRTWTPEYGYQKAPIERYQFSNLGGSISQAKKRIQEIERMREQSQKAEDAGGVVIEEHGQYVAVTFAEKPARSVLNDLKAAGFRWGGGGWLGDKDKVPACVLEMVTA